MAIEKENVLELSQELYEIRNLIGYIRGKLNVDSKAPTQMSDIPNCIRVLGAFKARALDFFMSNFEIDFYATGYKIPTSDLMDAFTSLSQKFDLENAEATLTAEQKKAISDWLITIDHSLMKSLGFMCHRLERLNKLQELEPDQIKVFQNGKKVFDAEEDLDDKIEERMEQLGTDDSDLALDSLREEEAEQQARESVADISAAQKRGKGTASPKKVISEKIDE